MRGVQVASGPSSKVSATMPAPVAAAPHDIGRRQALERHVADQSRAASNATSGAPSRGVAAMRRNLAAALDIGTSLVADRAQIGPRAAFARRQGSPEAGVLAAEPPQRDTGDIRTPHRLQLVPALAASSIQTVCVIPSSS